MPKGSSRAAPQDTDPSFKKTIDFRYRGHSLRFRASQSLFSSHEIDRGTRLLLQTLDEIDPPSNLKILDIGCGYGVLGLSVAAAFCTYVHLVDRDALAVQYASDNAKLNGLDHATTYASLGFDDVTDTDFDLVVSNLPGKVGESVLTSLLSDTQHFLKPGGTVAVVVVSALAQTISSILDDCLDTNVLLRNADRGHTVFHFGFQESTRVPQEFQPAFQRGVYDRGVVVMPLLQTDYRLETAQGLAEFDTLSYQTKLLIESLIKLDEPAVRNAIVINPGQGHLAVAVQRIFTPSDLTLVDRDLLALRYSLRNLALDGCPSVQVTTVHSAGLDDLAENWSQLTVLSLVGNDTPTAQAYLSKEGLRTLAAGGVLLVGGSSTAVTRLEKLARVQKRLRVVDRKRRSGTSVLVLRNR